MFTAFLDPGAICQRILNLLCFLLRFSDLYLISGEAMEKSLRECCRSIRIGKMLIRHDDEDTSKHPKVFYIIMATFKTNLLEPFMP